MGNYDRFRAMSKTSSVSIDFIKNSNANRIIENLTNNEIFDVIMTNSYKEGGDEFILISENYTTSGGSFTNLKIGDFIKQDSDTFLLYEEYNHPNQDSWLKFKLLEMNQIGIIDNSVEIPIFYGSTLRKKVSEIIDKSSIKLKDVKDNPLIITRSNTELTIGKNIDIKNKSYRIIQKDSMSNQGIDYITLQEEHRGTSVTLESVPTNNLNIGERVSLKTHNGFYECADDMIIVISRTENNIVFMPQKSGDLEIITQDENENLITTMYSVGE